MFPELCQTIRKIDQSCYAKTLIDEAFSIEKEARDETVTKMVVKFTQEVIQDLLHGS